MSMIGFECRIIKTGEGVGASKTLGNEQQNYSKGPMPPSMKAARGARRDRRSFYFLAL
jgi:hypothetical protein